MPIARVYFYLGIAVAVVMLGLGLHTLTNTGSPPDANPQVADSVSIPAPVPTVGGPFSLVDQNGMLVSDRDFRGSYMLIFFGYTYCPDICPVTMSAISEALDLLGEEAKKIQPLFITVDPFRDSPEQVAAYLEHFHPRFIGLTGTSRQVDAVHRTFAIYSAKSAPDEPSGDPDDYLVDHTSIIYFMGPNGEFLEFFNYGVEAEAMALRIRELLRAGS